LSDKEGSNDEESLNDEEPSNEDGTNDPLKEKAYMTKGI
jgi:hypothetical protein